MAKLFYFETLLKIRSGNILNRNAFTFCLILWILVYTKASYAKSAGHGGDAEDMGLIETRFGTDLEKPNKNFTRKRIIRVPVDQDTDTDNSEEDNIKGASGDEHSSKSVPTSASSVTPSVTSSGVAASTTTPVAASSTPAGLNTTRTTTVPTVTTVANTSLPSTEWESTPNPFIKGEWDLPKGYNKLVIPKKHSKTEESGVNVKVYLNIISVRDIDESAETLTLNMDLEIKWTDASIYDKSTGVPDEDFILAPDFLNKLWTPDVYIDEIVKAKQTSLINKPLTLQFNPFSGFIQYSSRLLGDFSCDMEYHYYPADTQKCEFTFISYSYFSKDMSLDWINEGVFLQNPGDANFDLQVESVEKIVINHTTELNAGDNGETSDNLKFTIWARRKLSFHLVQTYLPSIFFVVITWLCFLVPARMVEARIGISMTTLLTLTAMFSSVRENTPSVSYAKAIDIWMVALIFFVFLTLLQFSVFLWLRSRRADIEERKLEQQRKLQGRKNSGNKDPENTLERSISLESVEQELRKFEKVVEFIEKFAFIIFSVGFTIFTIVYWTWLLVASEYFNWIVNSTLNEPLDKKH